MLFGVVIEMHRGENQAEDLDWNVEGQEEAAQQDIKEGGVVFQSNEKTSIGIR